MLPLHCSEFTLYGEMITKIIRQTFFHVIALGLLQDFPVEPPKRIPQKIVSCMGPCPVRAPPVIAPGAITGFSGRAPENNSKIIFSCL